ncbi:MAG: LCP family protein [Eubacteriales bacterium]|nr:LCP family protein [Eubacteriales bacterium]
MESQITNQIENPSEKEVQSIGGSDGNDKKEPKKSRKRGRKRRIFAQVIVCLLLVMLFSTSALGGAVAAYYRAATTTIQTDTETALKDADVVETDLVYDQDVVNILLIGADKRANETEAGRSDTTMIATIDLKNGKLKLTSLMRDMYINVPGYGYHKFNAAYAYGGVQLEYETIADSFGIKLDGYVEVDMEAFREVVDLIGGVPMDLTEAEAYFLQTAYVNSKHGEKNVVAGSNLLTPYQALAYCRIRQDVSGEFGRTDRQRKILISVFNELKNQDIMTITNICMKALRYVKTDLTEEQIRSLMTSVISMGTTEIEQLRIPYEGSYSEGRLGGNGAWVMQVDYERNRQALQYFIFGTGTDPGVNDEYGVGNNNFIKGYYPEKTEGIDTY